MVVHKYILDEKDLYMVIKKIILCWKRFIYYCVQKYLLSKGNLYMIVHKYLLDEKDLYMVVQAFNIEREGFIYDC